MRTEVGPWWRNRLGIIRQEIRHSLSQVQAKLASADVPGQGAAGEPVPVTQGRSAGQKQQRPPKGQEKAPSNPKREKASDGGQGSRAEEQRDLEYEMKVKELYKRNFKFFKRLEKIFEGVEVVDGKRHKRLSEEELKDYCVVNYMLGWKSEIKGEAAF